jgi:fructose-1-phosphate kinase PfkB-like protein
MIETAFGKYAASQAAAGSISQQMSSMNAEDSMLSAMLQQMEQNFDATGEDLIRIATSYAMLVL